MWAADPSYSRPMSDRGQARSMNARRPEDRRTSCWRTGLGKAPTDEPPDEPRFRGTSRDDATDPGGERLAKHGSASSPGTRRSRDGSCSGLQPAWTGVDRGPRRPSASSTLGMTMAAASRRARDGVVHGIGPTRGCDPQCSTAARRRAPRSCARSRSGGHVIIGRSGASTDGEERERRQPGHQQRPNLRTAPPRSSVWASVAGVPAILNTPAPQPLPPARCDPSTDLSIGEAARAGLLRRVTSPWCRLARRAIRSSGDSRGDHGPRFSRGV